MQPTLRVHRAPGLGRTRADSSVRTLIDRLAPARPARSGRMVVLTLMFLSLTGCFLFADSFPDRVVSPEVVGVVQSADRTVTVRGTEYDLDPFADYAVSRAGKNDLLLYGTQPDVWYVAAHPAGDNCYHILGGTAYDDGDSVVVMFSGFAFGVRLEKGEGFDDLRRPVATQDARAVYVFGSQGVDFCLDANGTLIG